jgi:hypothetical protein
MGISNFSSDDVLVGAANLVYAPTGTTLPDESSVDVNDFANWPSGWIHLGYTQAAPSFSYSYEVFEVEAQQATAPLKRSKISEVMQITSDLLQISGDHVALVTGGSNTDTPAGAGQKGYSKVTAGGSTDLPEYMFALEGYRADDDDDLQPVRLFLWRATIQPNGDIAFAKDGATVIPIQISALTDSSKSIGAQLYEMHIVTAKATS